MTNRPSLGCAPTDGALIDRNACESPVAQSADRDIVQYTLLDLISPLQEEEEVTPIEKPEKVVSDVVI